ncbi:tetratricopeptide repeat protein [Foetidibacter luteolus]|uniref:tetratricopeptide repeat protein n=1 Tax=Foetidibacter luteolus TaxID=2608880 RepID=UPI001F34C661|nr:tetratricopeptide repeat protein [Foetidibacter luteolus]
MKKQQLILLLTASVLLIGLFFFGRTIPRKESSTKENSAAASSASEPASSITTDKLVAQAKAKLTAQQVNTVNRLEKGVVRGDIKTQQKESFKQLATFWGDTVHQHLLGAYYLGESAKLENSEKNLNFAARLFLDDLVSEHDPEMKKWMGLQAKALLEKSLEINPANDSAKVGIGVCYLYGNISNAPMQGIQLIREVLAKNPHHVYAHMILGLGGVRSGQYDKAIEHFNDVLKVAPDNLEAAFNLAEAYEQKGDKPNAVKWYGVVRDKIQIPQAKQEIDERIKALQ